MQPRTKKSEKRDAIAASALDLFGRYGYKSVSMDQIAQHAGVAKGTVYLYFKDKAALIDELTDETAQQIQAFVDQIKLKHLPLAEEIPQVIYQLLIYRNQQRFLYRSFMEARELKTPLAQKIVRRVDELVETYLRQRLGSIPEIGQKVNIEALAFVIMKVYSALAFEWEEHHKALDEKQVAEVLMYLLKGSLAQY
ncbi:MAG: TetR/AcrR family transcriptional regulator [Oscillospiraceae bacterium]|nr:TetR/AcrR family transcriptional regulator [Oscillospiraceae bacterium]MDD4368495.1 TetR/AcrR family transcriptional regulator [Oscillospiraceae bacterium]